MESVFEELAKDHHKLKLKDLKREILVVTAPMTLFSVWELMLQKKEHMALVVDESDAVSDMQQLAKERWEARQEKYNWLNKND